MSPLGLECASVGSLDAGLVWPGSLKATGGKSDSSCEYPMGGRAGLASERLAGPLRPATSDGRAILPARQPTCPSQTVPEMMTDTERKPAVHDQVLVEGEIDGKVVGFRAVIVNVMPTALWLGMPLHDPRLQKLSPEQPIHLTFRHKGAAVVAASTFLSHLGASRSRLFSIEWPSDFRMVQRRAHIRIDAECHLDYLVVRPIHSGTAGQTGRGTTQNISAGGVQFKIRLEPDEVVEIGDQLEIALTVASGAIHAEAEVIRVEAIVELGPGGKPKPPRPGKGPLTAVAVRFTSISEGAQDRIIRHIFALQRKRRQTPQDRWGHELVDSEPLGVGAPGAAATPRRRGGTRPPL